MGWRGPFLFPSNRNPLHFIERNLVLPAVVKLRRARAFVVGDVLRDFELAAVLQVRGDRGSAEGMISDPRLDAGVGRAARTAEQTLGQLFFLPRPRSP